MSASENLQVLLREAQEGGHVVAAQDAWPQMLAVVEAAERLQRDPRVIAADLGLRVALAALEEALSAGQALDPLGYISLDEHGTCPHDYAKGLGCHVCDPAGSPDAGQCVECGRQMTTAEAIRSDACPDCDPAKSPK